MGGAKEMHKGSESGRTRGNVRVGGTPRESGRESTDETENV